MTTEKKREELIKKVLSARLSAEQLEQIIEKLKEILNRNTKNKPKIANESHERC